MTLPPIQAGIRFFLPALVLTAFLLLGEAKAATLPTKEPKDKSETEEVLSLDDLLSGTLDLLPTIAPKDTPPVKGDPAKTPAGEKSDKGESSKEPADVPVTKTLEKTPAVPEAAKNAPYRVYPSPYVPDEMPVSAPLPGDALPEGMVWDKQPSAQTFDVLSDVKTADLPPRAGPATAPVAGMSRQYFPILPLSASQDAAPQLLPLFSNRDLGEDHSVVTRAIVFIHDLARNANEGLAMMTTLAGADNGTAMILAPQFPIEVDIARFAPYLPDEGRNVARWPVGRSSGWQSGEDSLARAPQKGISSFTAMDLLLLYLADRRMFPGLQQIVVAGHGTGADFVQRYAAIGQAPDILEKQFLPLRFLAANASSYLYFTGVRPASNGGPSFAMPDAAKCSGVNGYPYGLHGLNPYARRSGGNAIRLSYPGRQVMFLISEKITADPYLDTDCAALAQGKDRLMRGRNYERYLTMSFGESARESQSFIMVRGAGYDPVALFGSYCGLAMLFGDGSCKTEEKKNSKNPGMY
ncbi:MAG: hypothetical protein PHY92_05140 [Alphaproteobacteria bacterium]|nr:hypothetical protein [Alphaproteobacteria bacterium]